MFRVLFLPHVRMGLIAVLYIRAFSGFRCLLRNIVSLLNYIKIQDFTNFTIYFTFFDCV